MKRLSLAPLLLLPILGIVEVSKSIAKVNDDCVERRTVRNAESKLCDEVKSLEAFDPETQLEVVEYKTDLDWKVAKPKLPWSKIVKLKSDLDSGYDLFILIEITPVVSALEQSKV